MQEQVHDYPMSGKVPYAIGQASVVRIPIPGTDGLCIELRPRGWVPPAGSTSTLFFQDAAGRRHLRLDYGYDPVTKTVDYHWNQSGPMSRLGSPVMLRPVGRGAWRTRPRSTSVTPVGCS